MYYIKSWSIFYHNTPLFRLHTRLYAAVSSCWQLHSLFLWSVKMTSITTSFVLPLFIHNATTYYTPKCMNSDSTISKITKLLITTRHRTPPGGVLTKSHSPNLTGIVTSESSNRSHYFNSIQCKNYIEQYCFYYTIYFSSLNYLWWYTSHNHNKSTQTY